MFIKNNFWFMSLCVMIVVFAVAGFSIPARIAIAGNAIVVLIEAYNKCRGREI